MTDLHISLPQETARDRAARVADWLLAGLADRGHSGVYVSKLGHLVVAFEAAHIKGTGDPYIDITLTSLDRPYEPDVVRQALRDVVEAHPSRRAYLHGKPTQKVSGRGATTPPDNPEAEIVEQLLDDCDDVSPADLRRRLRHADLPWA